MATTPTYSFPAPDTPDAAHGPDQILALAQAVENLLTTGVLQMSGGTIQAGTIEVTDPASANHPVTKGWYEARILLGPEGSAPAAGAVPDGTLYFGY
jgi:hypothetical protein